MKELIKENFLQIFLVDFIWLFALLIGLIVIYGTWKNWMFFVNPSEDFWWMWSSHWVRDSFGEETLKFLNYFFGLIMSINAIWMLILSLLPKLKLYFE